VTGIDDQIARTRAARLARQRTGFLINIGTIVVVLALLQLLPDKSPLIGVAVLGLAASNAVMRLFVEGRDDWQWHRAVIAFALGSAAGLASLLIDAATIELLDSEPNSPGFALSITAAGWLIADLILRIRTAVPSDEDVTA